MAFCAAMLVLVWTAGFGTALDPMWAWFGRNKEAAGWVQAFGSIAAILATAAVVWWQETRRREDIRIERLRKRTDQLEGLVAMGRRLVDIISDVQNNYGYFYRTHSQAAFDDLAAAFAVVPVHDARSYSVATAIMRLRHVSVSSAQLVQRLADYYSDPSSHNAHSSAWSNGQMAHLAECLGAADEAVKTLVVRLAHVDRKLPKREQAGIGSPEARL